MKAAYSFRLPAYGRELNKSFSILNLGIGTRLVEAVVAFSRHAHGSAFFHVGEGGTCSVTDEGVAPSL